MVGTPSSWAVVIASHLIRSVVETYWGNQLESQVASLRVEIHRTRELVTSYNLVLENCERDLSWANRTTQWAANINIALGLCLLGLWGYWWLGKSIAAAENRFLSVTNASEHVHEGSSNLQLSRRGPVRPSDLAVR